MNIICNPTAPITGNGAAVAYGTFDGLHKGHIKLIHKMYEFKNLEKVVYTFSDIPSKIAHNRNVKHIVSKAYKEKLFRMLNIDYLVIQDFTKEFMNKEPEEFFYDYVIDILNTKVMIVGYDFVFGFCNKGDISLLKQLCKENKIELIVIPPVKVNDTIVSSTLIRKLILKGELDEVKNMLGRPFSIYSPVVRGKQIGSTIGFPTANMQIDGNQALPPEGVYATTVNIEDKIYLSVSNLGKKPTFGREDISLETFIIDFKGNLYNKSIIINFHKKIRNIQKFDSINDLKGQIAKDCLTVKEYFENKVFTN